MSERGGQARSAQRSGLALKQLRQLLQLWWRKMCRQPVRVGAAPKKGGVPTFLLLNLLILSNLLPTPFVTVRTDVRAHAGFFALHLLGFFALALGLGILMGSERPYEGRQRGDEQLLLLPLSLTARIGAQIVAAYQMLLMAMMTPLAAAFAEGQSTGSRVLTVTLGLASFALTFLLAQAAMYWLRALDLSVVSRYGMYFGGIAMLPGAALSFVPLAKVIGPGPAWPLAWWVGHDLRPLATLGFVLAGLPLAYGLIHAAERRGFDKLEAPPRVPRIHKTARSRTALEFRMITRQGAWRQLAALSILIVTSLFLIPTRLSEEVHRAVMRGLSTFAIYVGAVQVMGQAGMAVRRDLSARAFLSTLPLSPHELLEGRTNSLRLVLIPTSAFLVFLSTRAFHDGDYALVYRLALALAALYFSVVGAVSVAFLSHGVGGLSSEGGESSSSFVTLLLVLPLVAIPMSSNAWGATMGLFAVIAIGHEARRAARHGVRWLDDPDDAVERETGVWRALLVASAFFAVQAFMGVLLSIFELPAAFRLALGFGMASLLLIVLTQREVHGVGVPKVAPARLYFWLLGLAGGFATAALTRVFARYVLPDSEPALSLSSPLESVALGIAVVGIAPIAEEYFFRGWLQAAIEHDLPLGKKHWAFALAALAFAMAHVGSYGVPQLLVGLVTGGLFARGRGLGPAMLAHAVHNGLVSLWPP